MAWWMWLGAAVVSLALATVFLTRGGGSRARKLRPVHAAVWVQLAVAFAIAAALGGWTGISGGVAACAGLTYVTFLVLLGRAISSAARQPDTERRTP